MTGRNRGYLCAEEVVYETGGAGAGGVVAFIVAPSLFGMRIVWLFCQTEDVFSVSFHPESAPGPEDTTYLFDRFMTMMEEDKHNA